MVVGVCRVELRLPGNGSLKEKRQTVKSMLARLHKEYNVGIAEVGHQDVWQRAILGIVAVSVDADYVHGLLTRVVQTIENGHWAVEVLDYAIELV